MTGMALLEQLIQLELKIGELYAAFARQPGSDLAVTEFWAGFAAGKEGRAAWIRQAAPSLDPGVLEATGAGELFQAEVTLHELDRILVLSRQARITPEAAISLACGIEFYLAEKHALVKPGEDDVLSVLMTRLASQDRDHLDRLQQLAIHCNVYLPPHRLQPEDLDR